MADNLKCKKPKPCKPTEPKKEIYPPATPAFYQCIGDYSLTWDGTRLRQERIRRTPDGTYSTVTVVNGCIVAYGTAAETTYTPPYCNPNPTSCQADGSGSTTGTVKISKSTGNTLVDSPAGLYAKTYIQSGTGVTIEGEGTQAKPYTINATATGITGGTFVGYNGIEGKTDENHVTKLGLTKVGKAGTYDGYKTQFTVDINGRITKTKEVSSSPVGAGAGLVEVDTGDGFTLGHVATNVESPIPLGGYAVHVDTSGHITRAERKIHLETLTYNLGVYNVTVSEHGSILGVQQREDVLESGGSFSTSDGAVITYDNTGRIIDATRGQTTAIVAPIRDMYRVSFDGLKVGWVDKFGTDIGITDATTGGVLAQLPDYITDTKQIQVNTVNGWAADLKTRELLIKPKHKMGSGNKEYNPLTITFRG